MRSEEEYKRIRKEIEKRFKKGSTITKLCMHDDADGLAAAVLFNSVYKVKNVYCPPVFGNALDSDVVVDQVPIDPMQPYLVFDHHPRHPIKSKRKYTLVYDDVPATLVVYNTFKDLIPKKDRWKVAVGLVGDGKTELIPPEIWKQFPSLLDGYSTVWTKYNKLNLSTWPVYVRISSGINAACKLKGEQWYVGYQILKNAQLPIDLVEDSSLKAAKDLLKEELELTWRTSHPLDLPFIRFWKVKSESKIERHMAPMAMRNSKKTTLFLNETTGRISIRGVLSDLFSKHLRDLGFQIAGHPGFGGGHLLPSQTPDELLTALRKFRIK